MTMSPPPSLTPPELALLAEALLDGVLCCRVEPTDNVPDLDGLERLSLAEGLQERGLLVPYDPPDGAPASRGPARSWMLTAPGATWTNLILNERSLTAEALVRPAAEDEVE